MAKIYLFLAIIVTVLVGLPILAAESSPGIQRRSPWTTSRIRGTPDPPAPYRIVEAFPRLKFDRPTCVHEVPGTGRLLVGELGGKILSIRKAADVQRADLLIDLLEELREAMDENGWSAPNELLLDLAVHPKFERNRYLFVSYVHPGPQPNARVSRFQLSRDDPPRVVPDSEKVIITRPSDGHAGGCIRFGPDGYLYISTGDGTGPNPPDGKNAGQDISNLLASILRIDVDQPGGEKPYGIPQDNPFVDRPSARGEVWAYGLRNPWRMAFDAKTGDLWAADIGWETWEMVHRIRKGGNYGWPIMEGRRPLRSDVSPGPTPIQTPVKDHPRTEGNSVTGGVVYRGSQHQDLVGSFVYGDYVTGKIWALRSDAGNSYSHRELTDTPLRIVAFGEGSSGELYVLDHDFTGKIYELMPSRSRPQKMAFPRELSETGLFASVKDLGPAPGVVEYSVHVPPWMDGGYAERLLALPDSSRIEPVTLGREGSPWTFPEGTVLVKTIFYKTDPQRPPLRLETQILHLEEESWRPYSYLWNDQQDDAQLVDAGGIDQTFRIAGPESATGILEQTWRVAGRAECNLCHNIPAGSVLGFVPEQVNTSVDQGGVRRNQLEVLAEMGVLDGVEADRLKSSPKLAESFDAGTDLNERARSYLHVNCGNCHNHGGDGTITIFLQRHFTLTDTKTVRNPNVGTFGIRNARIVSPGDPYGSVLLYRMGKLGYARMPHVGSRAVDPRGFTLIHDWIASLESPGGVAGGRRMDLDEKTAVQVLAGKKNDPAERQQRASRQLLGSTRGAVALVSHMHGGRFAPAIHQRVVELSQQSTSSDVRGLFETFLPESERRVRLGPDIRPEMILSLKGDVARGNLIYSSDASRCRTCHPVAGQGDSLGPDLKQIGKKYPRPVLLTHILDPSVEIAPEFATYSVITDSGKIYSGLIVERTPESVVLKNTDRETIRIPVGEVDAMQRQAKSMMPEMLLRDMTAQEAADLLEYLSSLR